MDDSELQVSLDEDNPLNHNVSLSESLDVTEISVAAPAKESRNSLQERQSEIHGHEKQAAGKVLENVSLVCSVDRSKASNSANDSTMEEILWEPQSLTNGHETKGSVVESVCLDSSLDQSNVSNSVEMSALEESQPIINVEDSIADPAVDEHRQITFIDALLEVGRRIWLSDMNEQKYTKGCFWSPDGTCLLVPVHKDGMHVIELPHDLYKIGDLPEDRELSPLSSAVHVPEAGMVYDCVWYPSMNSQDPVTCTWLATRQHEPINMWDAFDGSQRCSYIGYDNADEVEAAISLLFSADGEQIYAGYKRNIKIFDTSRPGRTYDEFPVKHAISCMAHTENTNTITCGNWHGYIQHFDLRCPPKQGPLFTLGGHKSGITQLRYNNDQSDSWQLFSGARKCNKLLLWDMRNYTKPLKEFQRNVETNQRILFDLCDSWLASGDTQGLLHLWNLNDEEQLFELPLHKDCCNGVSFNSRLPILATSSGQFHFAETLKPAVHLDSDSSTAPDTAMPTETSTEESESRVVDCENAVLFLWFGTRRQTNGDV